MARKRQCLSHKLFIGSRLPFFGWYLLRIQYRGEAKPLCIQSSECGGDLDCSPVITGGPGGCQARVLLVVMYVPTCPDVGEVGLGHTTGLSMQLKQNGSRRRSSDVISLFPGGRARYSVESQIVSCGAKPSTTAEFCFSDLVPGYRDPAGRALLVNMELDRDQYMSLHDVGIPRPVLSLERQRGCRVTGSERGQSPGPRGQLW